MFLEPTGPADAAIGTAENYTDPTSAWTRTAHRMYCANNFFVSNWLLAKPIGMTITANHAVEIKTPVVNSQSNAAVVRGNRAASQGYIAYTADADGTHLKLVLARLDNSTTLTVLASSAAFPTAPAWPPNNFKNYIIRIIPTGSTIVAEARYYHDPETVQATITVTDSTYASGDVGAACFNAASYISWMAVWLPASETLDITPDTLVVVEGDSRAAASYVLDPVQGWADKCTDYLGRKFQFTNLAVVGSTIADMAARSAAVDALYSSSTYDRCLLAVQIGTNSLNAATDDNQGTAIANTLFDYFDARIAVGFKPIVIPETRRSDVSKSAHFDANLLTFRVAERDEWPNHARRYANVLAVPELGATGAENDTDYYFDGLHWSDLGHTLATPVIAAKIKDIRDADLEADAGYGFTTVSFNWKVNGVATAITSAQLADPTDTFGVKRLDTGEAVIASGRPMTQTVLDGAAVDGSYYYTFANPAEGLSYFAYFRIVYNGTTTFVPKETTDTVDNAANTPSSAAGRYAVQSDIEDIFGVENVAAWSDLSNAGSADVDRIQTALDNADSDIDSFFRDGPFSVPLVLASESVAVVTGWAAIKAGVWLYQNRGQWDQDKQGNAYAQMLVGVNWQMVLYKGGTLRLNAWRRWPTPSAPTAV